MRGKVGRLQALNGDVRIYLRGGNARMAKESLNTSQIRPIVQKMRGKAVTQFMRR